MAEHRPGGVATREWGAGRAVSGPPIGTNPFARAAMLCGGFGLAPLGLVFGVVALVQTRRTGQRGRAAALGGIVASVVWGVILTSVLTMSGVLIDRGPGGGVAQAQEISVYDVQKGDCFDWTEVAPDDTVQTVRLVPCSGSWSGRIYATPELGLTSDTDLQPWAEAACRKALPAGGGAFSYVYPKSNSASRADRQAACFLLPSDATPSS